MASIDCIHCVQFPNELLATIFDYLDKDSKLKCRFVCKNWSSILEKYFLTATVLLSNKSLEPVLKCNVRIKKLNVRNLTSLRLMQVARKTEFRDNLKPMELVFKKVLKKKLAIGSASVTSENMIWILQQSRESLKFLYFDYNTLLNNSLQSVNTWAFTNLNHLKICINSSESEKSNLESISDACFPNLEKLQILNPFQPNEECAWEVYRSYYKIVAKNSKSLRVLNLVHPLIHPRNSSNIDILSQTTTLPSGLLEDSPISSKESECQIRLSDVYLNLDSNEAIHAEANNALTLLQNQKNLRILHVNFRKNQQMERFGVSNIIANNSSTLQIVDLIATKRLGRRLDISVHLEPITFQNCNSLRVLRIVNYKIPSLPHNLPYTLEELLLWGNIGPDSVGIIRTIRLRLKKLTRLDIYDTEKNELGNEHLETEMMLLIQDSYRLTEIFLYKQCFDVDFLLGIPNLVITLQALDVKSKWCWPMKKFVLKNAHQISIQRAG